MGCDIHMYTEYKCDEKWHTCDYFILDNDRVRNAHTRIPMYDDRNYSLFATLADVRNYGKTDCICLPKGFPDDACEYIRDEYDSWSFDAHSCSYFTLRELIDFQEECHPLRHKGMLSPEQLKDFNQGILPTHWSRWATGSMYEGYELREWEEDYDVLAPLVNKLKERANDLNLIYDFEWNGNRDALKRALEKAERIRIVFWFDN